MIVSNEQLIEIFKDMLRKQILVAHRIRLKLLYRSSEQNGDKDSLAFHNACDGKGSSITIVKSEYQRIFGAYTNISWGSVTGYKEDSSCFLFSYGNNKLKIHKNSKNNGANAVFHYKDWGPSFGDDDIVIFGANSYCISNRNYKLKANEFVGGSTTDSTNFKYVLYEVYLLEID
eukprot:245161_1